MLMRRTIGISLAFLVISTGAMAAPPQKAASHSPDRPGAKPQRAAQKIVQHQMACRSASDARAPSARHVALRRHRQTAAHLAAHDGKGASDTYPTPANLPGDQEIGKAAWYNHVGSPTSTGERLDTVTATAAHRTLPLYSYARVTHLDTRRSVIVKINDRGPWTRRFIIDLSPRAANELGMRRAGVASVAVEPIMGPAGAARATVATSRNSGAYMMQ
jgi:rare lipoprotein A